MKRFTSMLAIASALAVIVGGGSPSHAATSLTTAGLVTGEVTIGGTGIPTVLEAAAPGCTRGGPTAYVFGSTLISGVIAVTNGTSAAAYAGDVSVTAGGGTECEDSAATYGDPAVGPISVSGSGSGTALNGDTISIAAGGISGTCNRVLTHVECVLTVTATVDPAGAAPSVTGTGTVTVSAEFAPDCAPPVPGCIGGDGVNTRVKHATFAGTFGGAGATA